MTTILAYTNHVESASSITASSADGSYPASNISLESTTKEWRTASGTSSATVVFDLGSAKAVDYIFLLSNALESLTYTSVTIEANTSDSWGAPAYTSGAITSFPEDLLFLATGSTQTYRYWRISVSGAGSFVGFSNLFLGQSIGLTTNNIDTQWTLSQSTLASTVSGIYGQRFITKYNDVKGFTLTFNLLTKDELDTVEALFSDRTVDKPFWFMVDTTEGLINTKEKLAGYFWINERPDVSHTSYGLYSISFSITQVI